MTFQRKPAAQAQIREYTATVTRLATCEQIENYKGLMETQRIAR